MKSHLERAFKLFAAQHGAAADRQLRSVGITWEQQRSHVRSGRWQRAAPGVVLVAGSPPTWWQQASIEVLAAGPAAALTAGAAARLYGVDGFVDQSSLTIAIPAHGHRRQRPGIDHVWSAATTWRDRHVLNGIAVTPLPLMLVDLAVRSEHLEQALDGVLRLRHSPQWLRTEIERYAALGIRGASPVRDLLASRFGQRLPRSWFQRLAKRALASSGLHLVDEHRVHDSHGVFVAELDLAHLPSKVCVECQSVEFHDSPADRYRDLLRKRRLRSLGWEIVEVWWQDLHRIDEVLADLVRTVADRSRLAGAPVPA